MKLKKPALDGLHREPEGARAKRPYAAPKLIEYGTVAKLTASGGTTIADGMVTMGMGVCL